MKHVPPTITGAPVGAPAVGPAKTPPTKTRTLGARKLRERAAAAIDELIALLDAIDGDSDLESTDRDDDEDGCDAELSLCGINAGGLPSPGDMEHDDSDYEASLGWTPAEAASGRGCYGMPDLEESCDDEGVQDDAEPSLGWTNDGRWFFNGPVLDGELDDIAMLDEAVV